VARKFSNFYGCKRFNTTARPWSLSSAKYYHFPTNADFNSQCSHCVNVPPRPMANDSFPVQFFLSLQSFRCAGHVGDSNVRNLLLGQCARVLRARASARTQTHTHTYTHTHGDTTQYENINCYMMYEVKLLTVEDKQRSVTSLVAQQYEICTTDVMTSNGQCLPPHIFATYTSSSKTSY
jgi:hypothetical protein